MTGREQLDARQAEHDAAVSTPTAPLLEVENLHVKFFTRRGTVHAVRGVSFTSTAARRSDWSAKAARARASPPRRCWA